MLTLIENGDILADADRTDWLINPVNCRGVMGLGLALEIRKRWPDAYEDYRAACREGLRPGEVYFSPVGGSGGYFDDESISRRGVIRPVSIAHFATKDHWRERSKLEWIENGLLELSNILRQVRLTTRHTPLVVAIPALGCGLGGLRWPDVLDMIEDTFGENKTRHDIRAYAPRKGPRHDAVLHPLALRASHFPLAGTLRRDLLRPRPRLPVARTRALAGKGEVLGAASGEAEIAERIST